MRPGLDADAAMDLADGIEALVRRAEATLEAARDATERDVAESELRAVLKLQDEVLEAVAPTLEARERRVMADVREAIASLRGDPAASWHAKHRRWMSAAVKARLVGMKYFRCFPW